MDFDYFKKSVDSLKGFPEIASKLTGKSLNMPYVGLQGGEVLYHPEFEKFCKYLQSNFPKEQCGLWTTFPKGKEKFREVICDTFGHIFLNSHSLSTIMHHPFLVQSQEIIEDKDLLFMYADSCFFQDAWSASINPNGAWFCEIAGAISILKNQDKGWEIESGWWKKTNKDYTEQIEKYCIQCGGCLPLSRRASVELIDDISPGTYRELKTISPKIKNNQYNIHSLQLENDNRPMAAYKDMDYRNKIANRYGIGLILNQQGFLTPYLKKEILPEQESLLERYRRENS